VRAPAGAHDVEAAPGAPALGGAAAPDLSVVIANRDTKALLAQCLESIHHLPDAVRVEVIVVDNGSTDGSPEMVADLYPAVRLIRNPTNTGFAIANNQGLAVARGRYLMLLNSDTVVREQALERLVRFMDAAPDVGACGPTLRYPDGRIQRSCFSFDSPWRHFCDMLAIGRVFPRSALFANQQFRFDHRHTAEVDWLIGAALVVRREVVEAVGVLDERFRIHCNDSDWCYRIHRSGYRVMFVHDAEIVHHSGATIRQEREREDIEAELLRNLFDYYRKHYGSPGLAWVRLWMVVGFAVRRAALAAGAALRPGRPYRAADAERFGRRVRAALTGFS
jgi:GT2 family glycosyltransferase